MTVVWVIIALVVVVGALYGASAMDKRPGELNAFATCLGEKGAIFYGAFWCPHCGEQKAMFGKSADLLPYVECSTPKADGQLPACTEQGVESYPTWDFADGSRLTGTIALEVLADKTGCELPPDA